MTTATSEDGTLQRLIEGEIESFLQYLRTARYADETLQRKRTIVREFASWARQHLIGADNLNSDSAAEFVARLPQRAKTRVALERATGRLFLEHLYAQGRLLRPLSTKAESDSGAYLQRYEDYLRRDRGLTVNSVHVYVPFIRDFLSIQTIQAGYLSQDAFDTLKMRRFLVAQTKDRRVSIPGFWPHRSGLSFASCFLLARPRGTSPAPFRWFVSTECRRRRHFFRLNKPRAFWRQQTDRHRAGAGIMPCCSCWPDSASEPERWYRSNWTIFAGGLVRSSSAAKAGWWTTCLWSPTLVKRSPLTFVTTVALVHPGGSFCGLGRPVSG